MNSFMDNTSAPKNHVLITGGSRGIGKAIAIKFASQGYRIGICGRTLSTLADTAKMLSDKYGVVCNFFEADALNLQDFESRIVAYCKEFGHPDILINNVGGGGRWGSENFHETSFSTWLEVVNKNLGAAVVATNLLIPMMVKRGFGRVITISSRGAREIGPRPWFSTAKAGQIFFMKGLAKNSDLVRAGLSFVTVAPGAIEIEGTGWDEIKKRDPEHFKEFVDKNFPLGRLGFPDEVANLVFFCAQEEAGLLNGSFIGIDGGESDYF